jgi:hypothetical protein
MKSPDWRLSAPWRWLLALALSASLASAAAPPIKPVAPPAAPPPAPPAAPATPSAPAAPTISKTNEARVLDYGRKVTAQFYKVEVAPIWAAFSGEMQDYWVALDNFKSWREGGLGRYGQELKVLEEKIVALDGATAYVRTASFDKTPDQGWYLIWAFDNNAIDNNKLGEKGSVLLFTIESAGAVK